MKTPTYESLSWSKSATLYLKSKCKIGYIYGTIISLNMGDDVEVIVQLKKSLLKDFEIKDLNVLKYFLGIVVASRAVKKNPRTAKPNRTDRSIGSLLGSWFNGPDRN